MSQHPSLKSKGKEKAHRSVWKRFERLKFLSEKDKWAESDSVYGLEKIKLLKVKIKKEKTVEAAAEGATGAEAAPATGATAAPTAGKGGVAKGAAAAPKGAAAKPAAKEEAKPSVSPKVSPKAKPEKPGKK